MQRKEVEAPVVYLYGANYQATSNVNRETAQMLTMSVPMYKQPH